MSEAQTETQSQDQKDQLVPKKAYEEVTSDLMKFKSKSKDLEEKLKAYEKEREESKFKSLKDKEEWQKLAEVREQEANNLRQELESNKRATTNYFKMAEVKAQAMKHGIRDNALDDLDLLSMDDVQVETTSTGKVNILGADKFVDRLKAVKPHWFHDKTAPRVDGSDPHVSKDSGPISAQALLKLQKEGKQADYEAALLKFKQKR
jgi:hypothetical protein